MADKSVGAAMGIQSQSGKKLIQDPRLLAGVDHAGICSTDLAAKARGDTSSSKKAHLFRTNHSTVDAVVFGYEMDDSSTADKRDFSDHAGTPSSAADHAGFFNQQTDANKGHANRSVADSLIFNRDIDGLGEQDDSRDFSGAAGNRSASADFSGLFSEKAERVAFEDIPHSEFAPPGKKSVKGLGSRAEEIIYGRPESADDDNYAEENLAFKGAAGETSKQASTRLAGEQMANKVKLQSGNSSVDKLIFGRDLDNSAADDGMEDMLYSGAGTRSHMQINPYDVASRSTELRTDHKLYGNVSVVGNNVGADSMVSDPRDYDGAAGSDTRYLSEHELSGHDITKRLTNGPGSAAVNPSEADELIFGRNMDKSQEDQRDFEGSAGEGGRLGRRNQLDITVNPPKRFHEGGQHHQVTEADSLIYGHALGTHEAKCRRSSLPDQRTMVGVAGGIDSKNMARDFVAHASGESRNKMVNHTSFDVIQGGQSTVVADLLLNNADAFDGAGVSSLRLSEKAIKDHKRADPVDMVADPNLPPGKREFKPMKKSEFASLHAAQADDLIYQHDLGDSANDADNAAAAAEMFGGCAGITSKGLAEIRTAGGPPQYPEEGPPDRLLSGSAGMRGSNATREAKSQKGPVDHRCEKLRASVVLVDKPGGQSSLQGGGSVASRANFRHHSQSARVGAVVFGKEAQTVQGAGDETAMLRGTVSMHQQEEHFASAAGMSSPDFVKDYNHRLDEPSKNRRQGARSDLDQVVFGHDVDHSEEYAHFEDNVSGAGKTSSKLANSKHWSKSGVGRAAAAGTVDDVVYHHDMDNVNPADVEVEMRRFNGFAGNTSNAVLQNQLLNDPSSRMHLPTEWHKGTAVDPGSINSIVFGHEQQGDDSGITGGYNNHANEELYAGGAGSTSGALNTSKTDLQKKSRVAIYDQARAQLDEVIYGRDLDNSAMIKVCDVKALQQGAAGKSAVVTNITEASESKQMVPHKTGYMAGVMFPASGGAPSGKIISQTAHQVHEAWVDQSDAAGSGSRLIARVRDREVEHIDGVHDSRKARARGQGSAGAAGKTLSAASAHNAAHAHAQPKQRRPASPGTRAYGKPSTGGGGGVADVFGGSPARPATAQAGGRNNPDAYANALQAGRQLVKSPYTKASRTDYAEPESGGDMAGNFKKTPMEILAKPRPETLTASAPFGVDPTTNKSTNARFATSSASIGSGSYYQRQQANLNGRVMNYEYQSSQHKSQPMPTQNANNQTALVAAAGSRPGGDGGKLSATGAGWR